MGSRLICQWNILDIFLNLLQSVPQFFKQDVQMDNDFIVKIKNKLIALKRQIFVNLAKEDEEFKSFFEDKEPKDLVDIAADDIGRSTLEALEAQELKRLNLIDSALSRIENGRYGYCVSCNKKIPKERLEAIPYAILCIECKTSEERMNR
jgi:DnaK suppressor protein